MNPLKINILLVEDDPNLSELIKDYLELLDYEVVVASDGVQGLELFSDLTFHLCILDIMMPKLDGYSLATAIRKLDPIVPIIFLSAKTMKEDRVKGFLSGCDDYMTKPFSSEELHMRIKAIMRRCVKHADMFGDQKKHLYVIGKFNFDAENMLLSSDFSDQSLTKKETALLELLCQNKNKLVTRDQALKTVWGENDYFAGRSMDVFLTKLRKYLKEDPNVQILNIHGFGFKLEITDLAE